VALPEKPLPREEWLTRSEAARLLWAAWRAKQVMRDRKTRRAVGRHVARFILVGLYSGTRSSAICGAAVMPSVGRGHVDLERDVFYRRAIGRRQTKKRQPPVKLAPRLLTHLRRWQRLGLAKKAVVEWERRRGRKRAQRLRCRRAGGWAKREDNAAHPETHLCDLANAKRRRPLGCGGLPRHDGQATRGYVRTPSSRLPTRGGRSFRGPEWGTKQREQKATDAFKRCENRRLFKEGPMKHLVRDEGVAGSNPATPTIT
jgi:hypothetical protein